MNTPFYSRFNPKLPIKPTSVLHYSHSQTLQLHPHSQISTPPPMAIKPTALSFLLLLLLLLSGNLLAANANQPKTWCVARPSSDKATLLANINYACSQVDCRIIMKGCPCSYPDNFISRASVAMNLYYNSRGKNQWNCDFRGSALIVVTDPSYGNCLYP